MSPSAIPRVGERIREERLRQGVTLRGLARAVGVSASLISQVETGRSQPSVSTLYAITTALGISVEDVFDARRPATPVERSARTSAVAATDSIAATGSTAAHATVPDTVPDTVPGSGRVGPLMRPAQREILELDSGVTWQRLGRVPGACVDFLLVTYAPGGNSSSTGALMRHPGTEYGYLLEGELTLTLAFEEHHLRPGDAISFESSTPHRFRNDADRPAVGVWFVSKPDQP